MNKGGRPKKEIKQNEFEKLCGLQCTKEEICAFFEITDKTLDRWCKETYRRGFSDVFREKRGLGRISLRRKQWKLADKSATMAIFLGKQYLDQTDKVEYSDNTALDRLDAILGKTKDEAFSETE